MSHACPIPVCTVATADGQLLCRDHWLMVPKAERDAVHRTWRAFRASGRRDLDELRAYQDASAAALATIMRALAPVVP